MCVFFLIVVFDNNYLVIQNMPVKVFLIEFLITAVFINLIFFAVAGLTSVTRAVDSSCHWRGLWARTVIASVVLGGPCTRLCTLLGSTTSMRAQTGTSIFRL